MARAISEAAKAEKVNIILDKAFELYQNQSYNSLKMIDIARACGFSKGIIFYYFNTKEKLFLEILNRENKKRFNYLFDTIQKKQNLTFDNLISFLLDDMNEMLDEGSTYMRLTAIMSSKLEENIDYETAFNYKQICYSISYKLSELISEKVGNISVDDCMKMFMAQQAIIIGYKNLSNAPDVVKRIINENQMDAFNVEFRSSSIHAMKCYLDGLKKECLERLPK